MPKDMKSLVSIVLVTLMLMSVFVGTVNATATEGWKTYTYTDYTGAGFSISYPDDWKAIEGPGFWSEDRGFYMTVLPQKCPPGLSVREYFEASMEAVAEVEALIPEELKYMIGTRKDISVEELEIKGIPAIKCVCTREFTSETGEVMARGEMEFYLKKGELVYKFGGFVYRLEDFSKYEETFEQIVSTFEIIGVPSGLGVPPEEEIIPPEEEVPEEVPLTPTPTPSKEEPGFEAVFAIAGLLAVAYLLMRRR